MVERQYVKREYVEEELKLGERQYVKREYVEKVMKTWNPHVPDDEVESTYRHMQADFQERVKSSLDYKLTEYAEALGHPPGPWVAQLEGAAIAIQVLESVKDLYLGEYFEEIEKRRKGINRGYYAHLWTIQDPDGWKKTPWEIDMNPDLFRAIRETFPEERAEFYIFTAARLERELYATSEIPELTEALLEEIREAIAEWKAAGEPLWQLSFADVTV